MSMSNQQSSSATDRLTDDELERAAKLYELMDDPESVLADARRQGLLDVEVGP